MLTKDIRKAQFVTDIRNLRGLYSVLPVSSEISPGETHKIVLNNRNFSVYTGSSGAEEWLEDHPRLVVEMLYKLPSLKTVERAPRAVVVQGEAQELLLLLSEEALLDPRILCRCSPELSYQRTANFASS